VDEPAEYAAIRSFLSGLLERMGVDAVITITEREGGGILVDLSGPGMGAVIGRRGETLDAIQHLTNYAVNHDSDKHLRISVDAENYRAKREESLVRLAEKMAEKTIKYKRSMALEPMNSYERHVIHAALQNYEGVTTASSGTEPNRRVVVSYVRGEEAKSHKSQTREWA
jgi:spoIIIJ-associated protein